MPKPDALKMGAEWLNASKLLVSVRFIFVHLKICKSSSTMLALAAAGDDKLCVVL